MNIVKLLLPNFSCQTSLAKLLLSNFSCQTSLVKLLLPNFSCQTSLVKLLLSNFSCQISLVKLLLSDFSQAAECMYVCMYQVHAHILLPVTNHYALKCVPCSVYYFSPILKCFYGILVFPACCMSVDYSIGVHSTFMFEHIVTKIVSQRHLYI